jgi:hypothetical protein
MKHIVIAAARPNAPLRTVVSIIMRGTVSDASRT